MIRSAHSLAIPLLLLAAVPLTPALAADRYNRSSESVHQPVVQRSDYVIDVPATMLDQSQTDRIFGWFDAIDLGYGDRVSLDMSAAGSDIANSQIAGIVGEYGLLMANGAPATEGTIPPRYVRIVVSRSTATVEGCPDFSIPSQPNFTGAMSSNYGCAINSTLAAMVANPEDLVRGQRAHGTDAQAAAKAIKTWRAKPPETALKIESSKGN